MIIVYLADGKRAEVRDGRVVKFEPILGGTEQGLVCYTIRGTKKAEFRLADVTGYARR